MKDDTEPAFETKRLPEDYDELAPDKSEIRPLLSTKGAGLAHCTLPPHGISLAVKHKRVEEIWYFIQGHGQVWRKQGDREEIVDVGPGICLTIPPGTHFQFRNTDKEPLCFIIATMPPWPGEQEAIPVPGYWEMDSAL
jgi:mannose-6-phosphate isomerase-like protein (cupin superfamily)